MANITDAELSILKNTLQTMRDALSEDESATAKEITKKIVESEQIVSAKMQKGDNMTTGSTNSGMATEQALAGGSAMVTQKTKELFSMFHLT